MGRQVSYARSGDLDIAYQVVGSAGPDLVFLPGFVSHLDLAWDEPTLARFMDGLSRFSRLIWFDRRGTGLSDPAAAPWTLADGADDVLAVMDAAGSRRAALFGVAFGAALSTVFALRHPDRTSCLVLWAAHARLLAEPDYPAGWTDEFFAAVVGGIERSWASGYGVALMNPSMVDDERFCFNYARLTRAAASPRQVREVFELCAATDLRPQLGQVRVPTLLLHHTDDPWLSVDHSRFVAARVPGSVLVELPGRDHWPWVGDVDAALLEVEAFLTGVRRVRQARPSFGPHSLTRRERTVAGFAARGLSALEIARRLQISERTAESHLGHVYVKLGVGSQLELVLRSAELGVSTGRRATR